MSLSEQFQMYQLAYQLVYDNGYEVIHINEEHNEIWLEKLEGKTAKVIRVTQKGFDWQRQLKRDIAIVFQKVKAMKKMLASKHIEIYNMYVSSYTPVDNWDVLKKPLQLDEKNPLKMKIYFIDKENYVEELKKFKSDINATYIQGEFVQEELETYIQRYKVALKKAQQMREEKIKTLFSYGKMKFTYVFIVLNIFLFLLTEFLGSSTDVDTLIKFGAKYNPYIMDGQWWRLVSSMFLHVGFIHLLMNMLALYFIGIAVEKIFGSTRYLVIYFLAGIGGSVASFAFTNNISAGASGAIFGLFGALLLFGLKHKRIFRQTIGSNIIFLIIINIIFGFLVPEIDNAAHLGGLVGGFLAASICQLPKTKNRQHQLLSFSVYIMLVIGITFYGFQTPFNASAADFNQIDELIQEEEYEEAIIKSTKQIESESKESAEIYFLRSFAYLQTNQTKEALTDLKKTISINDEFPEAHYNLALIYHSNGDSEKAKEAISRAYELEPDDTDYEQLYEEIKEN